MILTFILFMLFVTVISIVWYALIILDNSTNFPAIGYWLSCGWQVASMLASIPHYPTSASTRILYLYNFTEDELIVAGIGLLIGTITAIVIFFDFGWYDDIGNAVAHIKRRWRTVFPTKKQITNSSAPVISTSSKPTRPHHSLK